MSKIRKNFHNVRTTTDELLNAPYGMQGASIINNTASQFGEWYCIIAIADNTTLDAGGTTVNWIENTTNDFTTNLDLITGLPYYGDFTGITLVDGAVICYNK